jgi:hypothetical protein
MDPVKLYYLLQEVRFPIRVQLRDGRSYEVPSREFAVVGKTYLDVGTQAPNAPPGIWARVITLQLQDISSIESLVPPVPRPADREKP